MPEPPAESQHEKGRVEDFNGPHQRIRDEVEKQGKKSKKQKDDPNKIYGWRHYYTPPKLKDFEPGDSLSARMTSAPPPPARRFRDASPGYVMLTLLREAHARGALIEIRASFNGQKDSDGKPWPKKAEQRVNHKFEPGTTMLQVARWLEENDHADVRMRGRTLQLYRPGSGVNRRGVILARGKNLVDGPKQGTVRDLATTAYVVSESGVHGWVSDKPARRRWGRIETLHSIASVRQWEVAKERGDRLLDRLKDPRQQYVYGVVPDRGANPYKDFDVGDFVYVLENGRPTKHRVRQIGLAWDNTGKLAITLTLSHKLMSIPVRDHRRLRALHGKNHSTTTVRPSGSPDMIAPEPPSPPQVTSRAGSTILTWDGKDAEGVQPVWDQKLVELHIGTTEDFEPTDVTLLNTFTSAGSVPVTVPDYETTYYAKFIAVDEGGDRSSPSEEVAFVQQRVQAADIAPGAVGPDELAPGVGGGTDGQPPSTAPVPTIIGGVGMFHVRFGPIVNADPVTYRVHAAESDNVDPTIAPSFAPSEATVAVDEASTQATVRRLPGDEGTVEDPIDRSFHYGITYWFATEARDEDVPAGTLGPVSGWVPGELQPITDDDVSAEYVYGGTVVGDQIIGGTISSDLNVSGTFTTRPTGTGQGIDFGQKVGGIKVYDEAGFEYIVLPSTSGQVSRFGGDIEARVLVTREGAEFRGDANLVVPGGALLLAGGISATKLAPGVDTVWTAIPINTDAKYGGELGQRSFDANACYGLAWEPPLEGIHSGRYIVSQHIPGGGGFVAGTRTWNIFQDGSISVGLDQPGWNMYGNARIGDRNFYLGKYLINSTWALGEYGGSNVVYNRHNPALTPALGDDGTDLRVAELYDGNGVGKVRRYTKNFTFQGFVDTDGPLYSTGQVGSVWVRAADFGGDRIIFAPKGNSNNIKTSFTGGALQSNEFWPVPTGCRGIVWRQDIGRFVMLGSDARLYIFDTYTWGTATSQWWAAFTLRDSVNGYETTLGPKTGFVHKKRSSIKITVPPFPAGIDSVGIYLDRKETTPANNEFNRQGYTSERSLTVATPDLNVATAPAPPTSNNFPQTTPAELRSALGHVLMSGNDRPDIRCRATRSGDQIGIPHNTWTQVEFGVKTFDPVSMIDISANTITIPVTGNYRILAGINWTTNSTGRRLLKINRNSTAHGTNIIAQINVPAVPGANTSEIVNNELILTAGDVLRFWCSQFTSAGTLLDLTADLGYPYFIARWVPGG